jgi:polyhydroxybutyrate depolymerase
MKKIICVIFICLLGSTFTLSGCVHEVPEDPHTVERTMNFDGYNRTYRVHIPSGITPEESPALVLVLHGGGGTAEGMERSLTQGGWDSLSDIYRFLVVYPDGIGKNWNDGRHLNDTAHHENIDDVGFLSALIDLLLTEFHGDPKKVYVTGISNGAMMSYRLAFDIPETIAAIAPVAGAIPTDILPTNISGTPVSVIALSGTKDPLVPWDGGMIGTQRNPRGTCISVPDSILFWVQRDNCSKTPSSQWLANTNLLDFCRVHQNIYRNGSNNTEVVLDEIRGGGHTWPGGYQYLPVFLVGRTCRDIDANKIIWEFFSSHPKQ